MIMNQDKVLIGYRWGTFILINEDVNNCWLGIDDWNYNGYNNYENAKKYY